MTPQIGKLSNASGTLTANTAATVLAMGQRDYLAIWNVDTSPSTVIWVSFVGTAAANSPGSFPITQYGNWENPGLIPTNAISLFSTAAAKYTINYNDAANN